MIVHLLCMVVRRSNLYLENELGREVYMLKVCHIASFKLM